MTFLVQDDVIRECLQLIYKVTPPQIYLIPVSELQTFQNIYVTANTQSTSYIQPIITQQQLTHQILQIDQSISQLINYNQSITQSTLHSISNKDPVQYNNCNNYSKNSIKANYTNVDINVKTNQVYKCKFCGKIYKRETNLRSHIQTHTDDGYKCKHCYRKFDNRYQLKQHVRTHSDIKPYKCSFCTKAFKQTHTLKDHERIHTGERPFKCCYCNKGFAAKCNLITHRRTHTGEKPYSCKECKNKHYASKSGYNSHMKRHHK